MFESALKQANIKDKKLTEYINKTKGELLQSRLFDYAGTQRQAQGDREQAKKLFELAIQLDANNSLALKHLQTMDQINE